MNRSTLAKRYLPLAAVVAVQLLIIAAVPSRAPGEGTGSGGFDLGAAGGPGGGLGDGSFTVDSEGNIIDPETGQIIGKAGSGGTGGGGSGGPGGDDGGGGGRGPTNPLGIPTSGDTGHCVNGRQFDPGIDFYAPPCIPKFTGKNPGATYQGVTDDKIKIVDYRSKGNQAVDAILIAQGAYTYEDQQIAMNAASQKFINANYELYGRKVEIKMVQGQCDSVPPDYRCLRNEVRQIIAAEKPYAIVWNTSLASPFFAEASAAKVVNLGGWHFRDRFGDQHAPYHYDVQISGTQAVEHFAEFYCKQMHNKNAIYAGDSAMHSKKRVLGVISTNDPENKRTIQIDLKNALSKCGASYEHEYYYSQDISTADQQRRAGVAAMRQNPEATTVLCFCDLVAPAFLYQTQEENNYRPENLIAGSGFMDSDKAARAYDTLLPGDPTCQCNPNDPNRRGGNNVFVNAFGLSQIEAQEPFGKDVFSRVWSRSQGGLPSCRSCGDPNKAPYESASQKWEYYSMLATMLQQAGPKLTPTNMALGAKLTAPRGDGAKRQRSVRPDKSDWTWTDNMRQVYWSPTRPSSFDGLKGSYVDLYPGRRFNLGDYAGTLTLPPKQGRGRP
jgi:hypothetical protein